MEHVSTAVQSVSAEQRGHTSRKGPLRPALSRAGVRTCGLALPGRRAGQTAADAAPGPSSGRAAASRRGQDRGCRLALRVTADQGGGECSRPQPCPHFPSQRPYQGSTRPSVKIGLSAVRRCSPGGRLQARFLPV